MKTKFHFFFVLAFALAFIAPKAYSQTLIQYWDFNKTEPYGGGGHDSLGTEFSYTSPADTETDNTFQLNPSYTAPSLAAGKILYTRPSKIQVGATSRDSIIDNGNPGSFIYDYAGADYHYITDCDTNAPAANDFIRCRNPSDSCVMYMYMPTTGYKDIQFQFALSASSAKGAQYNVWAYSTNGGTSWKNLTTAMDTFNISGIYRPDTLQAINPVTSGSDWYPVQINFSSDPAVNNNSLFVIRMMLTGPSSLNASGNDRYDNFSLLGTVSTGVDELTAGNAGYDIYPNPAGDFTNLSSQNYTGLKTITIYNVVGQAMSVSQSEGKLTQINTSSLSSGVYFVEVYEATTGNRYTLKLIKN